MNSRFCSEPRYVGVHPTISSQHGVSIQISISLGKTFLRISRIGNTPLTWILARVFVYVPPFISQILDFISWTVLIFLLIYFEWRDTENLQYANYTSLVKLHWRHIHRCTQRRNRRLSRTPQQTARGHTVYQGDLGKWQNNFSRLLGHSRQQQTTNDNLQKTDTYQQITRPASYNPTSHKATTIRTLTRGRS